MDSFAVPYREMHPTLQEYYEPLKGTIFARVIRHAQLGQIDFVRTCCEVGQMFNVCREKNIDPIRLGEDIIRCCEVTENDIEYYIR